MPEADGGDVVQHFRGQVAANRALRCLRRFDEDAHGAELSYWAWGGAGRRRTCPVKWQGFRCCPSQPEASPPSHPQAATVTLR